MRNLIILLALSASIPASGQCVFKKIKWGVEAGVISTGWPEERYPDRVTKNGYRRFNSIVSPVLGITGTYKFNRYLSLSLGLQYFRSGERTSTYSEDSFNFPTLKENYTYTTSANFYFDHLSLPLQIQFTPFRWKLSPVFSLGIRANYLAYGHYDHREEKLSSDPEKNILREGDFNIFKTYDIPPERVQYQALAGGSIKYKRFMLSLNYSHSSYIDMAHYRPMFFCGTGAYQTLQMSTTSLSLKYDLSRQLPRHCYKNRTN